MKLTKILALVLAVVLCICSFAACGEKKNNPDEGEKKENEKSTVSVTVIDNEGNEVYKNAALDINPETDGTEEGKLFIDNILDVCCYYDDSLSYEYDSEEGILEINGMKDILTVTEQVAKEVEPEPTEKAEGEEDEEEKEPVIVYEDVDFCYYWSMTVNEKEVALKTELKPGDNIVLHFFKEKVEDMLK